MVAMVVGSRKEKCYRLLVLLSTGVVLCGCGTWTIYDTPYLKTRIIDVVSKQPIIDAQVVVCADHNEDQCATGVSDKVGNVELESHTHKIIRFLPVPYDTFPPGGTIRVVARGYAPLVCEKDYGIDNTKPIELTPMK